MRSTYAVVKVERSTGEITAVIGRGLAYHHADRLAADLGRRVEPGHYITARNDNTVPQQASKRPATRTLNGSSSDGAPNRKVSQ